MNRLPVFVTFFLGCLMMACNDNEIGDSDDVNPDNIYFDYKVWGEESDSNVNVLLQFRFAGPNGTTLLLKDPSKVELDGKQLAGDSSKMTGAYYEMIIPKNQFTGTHSIRFTDANGKTYEEKFSFMPLRFKSGLNDTITRSDLRIELDGLDNLDIVRLIITDTSFTGNGINRFDNVREGVIHVSAQTLDSLASGPVHIEIYRESERDVKQGTSEGGKLSLTYGIKKEIFLRD